MGGGVAGPGRGGRDRGHDWLALGLARAVSEGFDVRLAEPVQARALLGRRRSAKTDRLDARWLARLLAKEMLPASWIPPEEIQQLRDRTRLRKALAEDRRRWGHSGLDRTSDLAQPCGSCESEMPRMRAACVHRCVHGKFVRQDNGARPLLASNAACRTQARGPSLRRGTYEAVGIVSSSR